MPLYEYRCAACEHQFEVIQSFSAKPIRKCEKCGGRVEKLISRAGFVLKGGGWYKNDYTPSRPGASSAKDGASESSKEGASGSSKDGASESSSKEGASGSSSKEAASGDSAGRAGKASADNAGKGSASDSKKPPAKPKLA